MTRAEEYDEIRNLLDNPKPGRPTPHGILSGLLATEQRQFNRLNNTGRSWTTNTVNVTTVSGTNEYLIPRPDFGKLIYAYRAQSDNSILPVPFTDYGNETYAPGFDYWIPTARSGEKVTGQKIAVFRKSGGEAFLRVYPVPSEAKTITLLYSHGAIDLEKVELNQSPVLREFARHRCLQTALFLLPRTEWQGYSRDENKDHRRELKEAMIGEFEMEEREFEQYIKNPSHESIGFVGNWYD